MPYIGNTTSDFSIDTGNITNRAVTATKLSPSSVGSNGQVLSVDGSGNLQWSADASGTALTGSTNNTITTVTGANAIQGEANLTFDGTTLKVSGASNTTQAVFAGTGGSGARGLEIVTESVGAADEGVIFNARASGTTGRLKFNTNSATAMTILGNGGNIGIGEIAPTFKTEIKVSDTSAYSSTSMANSQTQLRINNAGASGVVGILLTAEPSSGSAGYTSIRTVSPASGSGDLIFSTRNASSFGERLRIQHDGRVGIGLTNPTSPLDITGGSDNTIIQIRSTDAGAYMTAIDNTGAGSFGQQGAATVITCDAGASVANSAIVFQIDANNERMRIDSSGRLLIGSTANNSIWGVSAALQVEGTTGNTSAINLIRNSNDGSSPYFTFGKSRGTSNGSATVVQDGDGLGSITWTAADGTDLNSSCASINAEVDGTPGSNDTPGRLVFSTTADGAASITERMRIDSSGKVGIGTTDIWAKLVSKTDSSNTSLTGHNYLASQSGIAIDNGSTTDGCFNAYTSRVKNAAGTQQSASIAFKSTASGQTPEIHLTQRTGSGTQASALTINSSQNATFAGTVSDSKGNLRSIPIQSNSGSHTLTAASAGKVLYTDANTNVNNSVFSAGDAVTIVNNSGSDQTITQGSGLTLYNTADASSGNRTLASRGMATIWFASASVAYISGAGLS